MPAAGAGPQPEDVFVPGERDPDGSVDGPVGDLPVPHLDHHRVDEDGCVDLIERPVAPIGHLLYDLAGDPGDGLLAHRRAVDPGEVRADLAGGQAPGIQRQHDLIDPGQPPLPLLDDLRLNRSRPVPGDIDADLAASGPETPLDPQSPLSRPWVWLRAGWPKPSAAIFQPGPLLPSARPLGSHRSSVMLLGCVSISASLRQWLRLGPWLRGRGRG